MVTLEKMAWEIRHILKAISDDSKINDRHLYETIHGYRAKFIEDQLNAGMMNVQWLQSFKSEPVTVVSPGDSNEPLSLPTVKFGKIEFPQTVFVNGYYDGFQKLMSTSGWDRFYETTQDALRLRIDVNDIFLQMFTYFFRVGQACYIYNFFGHINADLILANPMDGFIYRNENVRHIIPGETYTVVSGTIMYNNVTIPEGDTFIGVDADSGVIGTGIVNYVQKKRKFKITDPYPVDAGMAQEIILTILSKDFQLQRQAIADVVNDSADTVEIMKGV